MKKPDNTNIRYAIYFRVLLIGILLIFMTFLPYLADYYILQPDMTVFRYYNEYVSDRYYQFETILLSLFVISMWCAFKRSGAAMLAVAAPLLVLSYASSIKYAARNELFRLDDLKLTEAAGMAARYLDLKFSLPQMKVIIIIAFLCVSGFVLDKVCRKYPLMINCSAKKLKSMRILAGGIIFLAGLCYGNYFLSVACNRESIDRSDVLGKGNDRYVLYNFLRNDSLADINMDNVEESYLFFKNSMPETENHNSAGTEKYPNVIVIMNESWWNTDNITNGSIAFEPNPMEEYDKLAENCSSGALTVNVFGGGTISSEMEFLTGLNTKYFVGDVSIYLDMEKRKIPSIVDYFNALDYDTVAIHPYYGEFYSRNIIYPKLGFDRIVFEEDMQYKEAYSKYISDESLVKQIIKEYEEGGNKSKFIYAVSIANHIRVLDYENKFDENYPYPVSVTLEKDLNQALDKYDYVNLVNYVNGIYLANDAFAQLVSYFEQDDEPVVVVMYGDHMPGFSKDTLELLGFVETDIETLKCQYSVPILMWNNFNTDKIEFTGENINYLPQIMLEYAGLPDSDMTRVLRYARGILKTNTRKLVEDASGQLVENYNREMLESVRHFKVVDYDILFGNSPHRSTVWQPYAKNRME